MSGQNPQTEPNNPGQQPTSKTDTELTQLTVSLPEGLQLRSLTVFERFKAFYTTNIYGQNLMYVAANEEFRSVGILVPSQRLITDLNSATAHQDFNLLTLDLNSTDTMPVSSFVDRLDDRHKGFAAAWNMPEQKGVQLLLKQPGHHLTGFTFAIKAEGKWSWTITSGANLIKRKDVPQKLLDLLNSDKTLRQLLDH